FTADLHKFCPIRILLGLCNAEWNERRHHRSISAVLSHTVGSASGGPTHFAKAENDHRNRADDRAPHSRFDPYRNSHRSNTLSGRKWLFFQFWKWQFELPVSIFYFYFFGILKHCARLLSLFPMLSAHATVQTPPFTTA